MPTKTVLRGLRLGSVPAVAGATVSVVVPCYNYARFLEQAVNSALSQRGVDVDVIIVDDASTDASLEVAENLAAHHSNVRVLSNKLNSGAVETFNRGLAEAKGEFLVRLDADDLLTPGSLQRSVAVMQNLPGVGLVYGHPLHFQDGELPLAREKTTGWYVWAGQDWLEARCRQGSNVITSPEVVMRRSVVDKVGGQRALAHTHDMEMWLRIAVHSDVAYVRGADQAWHRDHAASLSTQAEGSLVIFGEIRDAFDVLFDGESTHIRHAEQLHGQARLAVASDALDEAQRALDRGVVNQEVHGLRSFAAECHPPIRTMRRWQKQQAQLDRITTSGRSQRVMGSVSRLRRRWNMTILRRRWRRSGVYEALRTTTMTTKVGAQ